MSQQIQSFGALPDGRRVKRIFLQGPELSAQILTLGATVQDLRLKGCAHPLVLGFETLAPYLDARGLYVGALVGRYANRVAGAGFRLDGIDYDLVANERGNQLHGGPDGLHVQLWQIKALKADSVTLTCDLADGHMGYPGNLRIEATISVEDQALSVVILAQSDAATPCSIAHHGYFTLDDAPRIDGYQLHIAADHYLAVDGANIPTGPKQSVSDTDFDFRLPRLIGEGCYDHNFCLSPTRMALRKVAEVTGRNGLCLQVETTEPGLQFYDGRHFNTHGLEGRAYGPRAGIALETQFWPDGPNRMDFPDAILPPGQDWRAETRYIFAQKP